MATPDIQGTEESSQAALIEELRQGSEARHLMNRLTPDGKELVEMVPLDWAVEVINSQVATRDAQWQARLEREKAENNGHWYTHSKQLDAYWNFAYYCHCGYKSKNKQGIDGHVAWEKAELQAQQQLTALDSKEEKS